MTGESRIQKHAVMNSFSTGKKMKLKYDLNALLLKSAKLKKSTITIFYGIFFVLFPVKINLLFGTEHSPMGPFKLITQRSIISTIDLFGEGKTFFPLKLLIQKQKKRKTKKNNPLC